MGDLKSGLKGAGFKETSTETKCQECGKSFKPRDPKHKRCPECFRKERGKGGSGRANAAHHTFEESYPDYFDADGLLKPEFVTTEAKRIAEALKDELPKMTMSQLRAFYGHVKRQQGALVRGRSFKQVLLEIKKLEPFACERASKDKIPRYFEDFIVKNVEKVKDEHAFLQGFVEHFQAVVAYYACTIRR